MVLDKYATVNLNKVFDRWEEDGSICYSEIDDVLADLPKNKRIKAWLPSGNELREYLKTQSIAPDGAGKASINLAVFLTAMEHFCDTVGADQVSSKTKSNPDTIDINSTQLESKDQGDKGGDETAQRTDLEDASLLASLNNTRAEIERKRVERLMQIQEEDLVRESYMAEQAKRREKYQKLVDLEKTATDPLQSDEDIENSVDDYTGDGNIANFDKSDRTELEDVRDIENDSDDDGLETDSLHQSVSSDSQDSDAIQQDADKKSVTTDWNQNDERIITKQDEDLTKEEPLPATETGIPKWSRLEDTGWQPKQESSPNPGGETKESDKDILVVSSKVLGSSSEGVSESHHQKQEPREKNQPSDKVCENPESEEEDEYDFDDVDFIDHRSNPDSSAWKPQSPTFGKGGVRTLHESKFERLQHEMRDIREEMSDDDQLSLDDQYDDLNIDDSNSQELVMNHSGTHKLDDKYKRLGAKHNNLDDEDFEMVENSNEGNFSKGKAKLEDEFDSNDNLAEVDEPHISANVNVENNTQANERNEVQNIVSKLDHIVEVEKSIEELELDKEQFCISDDDDDDDDDATSPVDDELFTVTSNKLNTSRIQEPSVDNQEDNKVVQQSKTDCGSNVDWWDSDCEPTEFNNKEIVTDIESCGDKTSSVINSILKENVQETIDQVEFEHECIQDSPDDSSNSSESESDDVAEHIRNVPLPTTTNGTYSRTETSNSNTSQEFCAQQRQLVKRTTKETYNEREARKIQKVAGRSDFESYVEYYNLYQSSCRALGRAKELVKECRVENQVWQDLLLDNKEQLYRSQKKANRYKTKMEQLQKELQRLKQHDDQVGESNQSSQNKYYRDWEPVEQTPTAKSIHKPLQHQYSSENLVKVKVHGLKLMKTTNTASTKLPNRVFCEFMFGKQTVTSSVAKSNGNGTWAKWYDSIMLDTSRHGTSGLISEPVKVVVKGKTLLKQPTIGASQCFLLDENRNDLHLTNEMSFRMDIKPKVTSQSIFSLHFKVSLIYDN